MGVLHFMTFAPAPTKYALLMIQKFSLILTVSRSSNQVYTIESGQTPLARLLATSLVQLLGTPMPILKSTQRTTRLQRWSRTASTIRTLTRVIVPAPLISAQDFLPQALTENAAQMVHR